MYNQNFFEKIKNYYTSLDITKKRKFLVFVVGFVVAMILVILISASNDFPKGSVVTIETGQSHQICRLEVLS